MAAGLLNYSDLQYWFETPRPTIMAWVIDARVPHPHKLPELDHRLKLLEAAMEAGVFPVPHEVSHRQRPSFIKEQYHAANDRGVSASVTS